MQDPHGGHVGGGDPLPPHRGLPAGQGQPRPQPDRRARHEILGCIVNKRRFIQAMACI